MRDFAENHDEALRRSADPERQSAVPASTRPARSGPFSAASVIGLQRSIGNAGTSAMLAGHTEDDGHDHSAAGPSPVHETISQSGTPLDTDTRAAMERHHGQDFSDVRLHVDAKSAESVKAAAYTVGNDIVMHPNHFSPGSPTTQRTLAHELTHVVQQRSGPVEGTSAPGGIKLSDPSDRFEQEAERRADDFVAGNAAAPATASEAPAGVQRLEVQRAAAPEEEELPMQGMFLQREEEHEEEGEE